MGYALSGLSALIVPLLAWLLAGVDQEGLSPVILTLWSLFPFAVLRVLYGACPTAGQRVMFFAGTIGVLLACLGFLIDSALASSDGVTGALLLLLPRYLSIAFLVVWTIAWTVDYFYQRTQHQDGHIGWGMDTKEGTHG